MAEPTPVIPPVASSPHRRRATDAPPPTADLLGDVDQATPGLAAGDADDLIARMADAQIDQLLADDDAGRPPAVVPASPPVEESPAAAVTPDAAAAALDAALAAMVETTPIEALAAAAESTAAAESPAAAPPADGLSLVAKPDADLTGVGLNFPASFSPPGSSKRTPAAESIDADAGPKLELPPLPAAEAVVADEPAHELQSDAEAVARELADDAALRPSRSATADVEAPVSTSVAEPVGGLRAVPMSLLEIINYPARSMSDNGREAMGAIAIVTLANATALLIYLVLFRA